MSTPEDNFEKLINELNLQLEIEFTQHGKP